MGNDKQRIKEIIRNGRKREIILRKLPSKLTIMKLAYESQMRHNLDTRPTNLSTLRPYMKKL